MSTEPTHNSLYYLLTLVSRSPLLLSRWLAKGLACIATKLKGAKIYHTIDLNLHIAFPHLSQQEHQRICKQAIYNEVQAYFEFFHIWGSSLQQNLARIRHVHGEHLLDQAIQKHHGVVLLIPHLGTWEIMNSWLSQKTQLTVMYKPVKNPQANHFVKKARSKDNAILVPTDDSGIRQIFRALKQGGTTVILPDHSPDHGGEMIPYFDIPLATSQLSAKLIQKTKATPLLLHAQRNDAGSFDMYIEAFNKEMYNCSSIEATQHIIHAIEMLIREQPEQYHWSYKRFSAHPALKHIYDIPLNDALIQIQALRQQCAEQVSIDSKSTDVFRSNQSR